MKLFLRYFLLFALSATSFSQEIWNFSNNKNKVVIPFQLVNNIIVLQPKLNNISLNLMLDSGSGYNILFTFPEKDSITFLNTSKIKITGPGMKEPVDAYVSRNNKIAFKNLSSNRLDVILMLEEQYSFTTTIGIPIHGILGADFFMNNIVEINYVTKKLIIYRKATKQLVKKSAKYKQLPFQIKAKKPYIPVAITIENNNVENLNLLLDTGLSDGLWIFEKQLNLKNKKFINDYFGVGIGGFIYGKRVRFSTVNFSDFQFNQPIISMPDTISYLDKDLLKARDGSVGGEILKRFNIILDYTKQLIYLQKNNDFDDKFYYNLAGLDVHYNGVEIVEEKFIPNTSSASKNIISFSDSPLNDPIYKFRYTLKPEIEISYIRKNSIADLAGLQIDDKILFINGKKANYYKLVEISELFRKSTNETIKLQVERKGVKFNVELLLIEEI